VRTYAMWWKERGQEEGWPKRLLKFAVDNHDRGSIVLSRSLIFAVGNAGDRRLTNRSVG
jgi:hypothetical protein